IVARVLELDEAISNGDAHLYMAVMESLLPPAMGGKPEIAKKHFERALEISGRKNLMAFLMYAEKYARLLFDRELHDKLLNELLSVKKPESNTLLIDTIARAKARELLTDADDYF
ncbi:MAG: TRAP transporter TatT component family protein, partial [Gammaproteobacteria bacterium]|nr:TRAP transporter TatT component family protein [Gammaproteobacteria bacterium]